MRRLGRRSQILIAVLLALGVAAGLWNSSQRGGGSSARGGGKARKAPICTVGCPCGDACIDCSKHCSK